MSRFRQGTARTCVSVAATLSDSEPVTSATTLSWRSVGETGAGGWKLTMENYGKSRIWTEF